MDRVVDAYDVQWVKEPETINRTDFENVRPAPADNDTFSVNGCVCACIVCCPMCSEYRRSPHDPWRFDEYKCGSLDDRHPWILTSADAMHGEVCCGDTTSACCGMKGWKRGA